MVGCFHCCSLYLFFECICTNIQCVLVCYSCMTNCHKLSTLNNEHALVHSSSGQKPRTSWQGSLFSVLQRLNVGVGWTEFSSRGSKGEKNPTSKLILILVFGWRSYFLDSRHLPKHLHSLLHGPSIFYQQDKALLLKRCCDWVTLTRITSLS